MKGKNATGYLLTISRWDLSVWNQLKIIFIITAKLTEYNSTKMETNILRNWNEISNKIWRMQLFLKGTKVETYQRVEYWEAELYIGDESLFEIAENVLKVIQVSHVAVEVEVETRKIVEFGQIVRFD
jgi:hypothetical protein